MAKKKRHIALLIGVVSIIVLVVLLLPLSIFAEPIGITEKKFNVHGGAVAIGHPIGSSGSRILITLMYAMKHLKKNRGLATVCLGGGNAVSMVVER